MNTSSSYLQRLHNEEASRVYELECKSVVVRSILRRRGSYLDCMEALVAQNEELILRVADNPHPMKIIVTTEELERIKCKLGEKTEITTK